jgi:hypothetical protein
MRLVCLTALICIAAARASAPSGFDGSGMEPTYPTPHPIVFASPGTQPDVRFMVLKQEFHLHSVILKLHSNFFRRFLDSADKQGPPEFASFRYEYVSVIDEKGEEPLWALDVAAKVRSADLYVSRVIDMPLNPVHGAHGACAWLFTNRLRASGLQDVCRLRLDPLSSSVS